MNVSYWNRYYEASGANDTPSSFAKFVLAEYSSYENILDVGCGNGRDSFYFAANDKNVSGIDESKAAIDKCNDKNNGKNPKIIRFFAQDVSRIDIRGTLSELNFSENNTIIYARFFLHAIPEVAQDIFLSSAAISVRNGALLCIEFRTVDDEKRIKVEKDHYRRFIDPRDIEEKGCSLGMRLRFFRMGTGMAVYGEEDPIVARMVFG